MTTPAERAPVGLLLVDKPRGCTSFAAVAAVRRRLGVRQVGHTGTLDPLATGLLQVLVGEATRLTPYLMGLDKVYEAEVLLGLATDSYDADGREVARAEAGHVTEAEVRAALAGFVGRIRQRPPIYSALRKDGVRLYEVARAAARRGEVAEVEVAEREVVVHGIELLECAPPRLRLRVHCGKGTYIRSIAHDLGEELGVHGHLTALRRTRIGPHSVADAIDLDALRSGEIAPTLVAPAQAVAHLPAITIDAEVERRLRLGQQAVLAGLMAPDGTTGAVRLLDEAGHLVAIAQPDAAQGGRLVLAGVYAPVGAASIGRGASAADKSCR